MLVLMLLPSLTTLPMYFLTRSGYSRIASLMLQKMTPALSRSALKVVAMDTLSNTASTATLVRRFCSLSGMPSFSNVLMSSGSAWSSESSLTFCLGSL